MKQEEVRERIRKAMNDYCDKHLGKKPKERVYVRLPKKKMPPKEKKRLPW